MVREPVPTVQLTNPTESLPEVTEATRSAAEVDTWSAMIERLELQGLTRQFARHCVLQQQQDRYLLIVRKQWAYLLNEGIVNRLREALSSNYQMTLADVVVGDTTTLTPAEIQDKINELQQQLALQRLAEDPNVRQLEQHFGVRLITDSLKPI